MVAKIISNIVIVLILKTRCRLAFKNHNTQAITVPIKLNENSAEGLSAGKIKGTQRQETKI